jgi:predicted GNAT superfamily acetyltransferase
MRDNGMSDEDLVIRPLSTPEDMALVEDLQREVWMGNETEVVPAHMLLAVAHGGGVVLGAFEAERLVGMVLGFLGVDPGHPDRVAMARLKHCSHMLAVDPRARNRGVGYRLKLAQRQAILQQGVRLATWTYDPLLSLNAHLNIRRLGAVCRTYVREAYGAMRDGLNVGLASDRFEVEWWVTSHRVLARLEGRRPPLDLVHYLEGGAHKVNPSGLRADGWPEPPPDYEWSESNLLLVEIPPDFQALRAADLGLARAWREHSRALFEDAFRAGYLVSDFIFLRRETAPRAYYVLVQGEATFG